ncbi:MAG: GNAT family N-acetyltransferase [Armatimonadota bacterium]
MPIRALREREFDEHAELVYVSYAHEKQLPPGSMLTHRDWWLRSVERDPYYEPAQTRVMEVEGRLVASVGCYYRPTYIDGRVVDAACIGSVCTHPDHRRRGYVRELLAEAVAWMTDRGWEFSWLYGLQDVYGGSGWRNLTAFDLVAALSVREQFATDLQDRPVDPDSDADVALLADAYARFCTRLTGPTVRNTKYWRQRVLAPSPWGEAPEYRLVLRAGQPLGYYCMQGAFVRELAWSGRPHELLAQVLRRAGGQPVSFACYVEGMIPALREISPIPSQRECFDAPGSITLRDSYKGLWRHHHLRDRKLPEVADTEGLVRFLRDNGYVMWPADRA